VVASKGSVTSSDLVHHSKGTVPLMPSTSLGRFDAETNAYRSGSNKQPNFDFADNDDYASSGVASLLKLSGTELSEQHTPPRKICEAAEMLAPKYELAASPPLSNVSIGQHLKPCCSHASKDATDNSDNGSYSSVNSTATVTMHADEYRSVIASTILQIYF
jgi:hypothetical protein